MYSVRPRISAVRFRLLIDVRALSEEHANPGLRVYMTGDGSDVYEDAFFKVAKGDNGTFSPTLVLVGIRLGIDRVTPVYWEALKASLQLSQSIGIAGSVDTPLNFSVYQADILSLVDVHRRLTIFWGCKGIIFFT